MSGAAVKRFSIVQSEHHGRAISAIAAVLRLSHHADGLTDDERDRLRGLCVDLRRAVDGLTRELGQARKAEQHEGEAGR